MKICLVNNLYEPYGRGGAESVVRMIKNGFEKEGHDVFIITTLPMFAKKPENPGKDNIRYIKSLYYYYGSIPLLLKPILHIAGFFAFLKLIRIKIILSEIKPDLVVSNNLLGMGFFLPLLLSFSGIKHIHIVHDIQLLHPSGLLYFGKEGKINSFLSIIYQFLGRLFFKPVEKAVFPSKWIMEEHRMRGFFPPHSFFLPNPADNHDFADTGIIAEKYRMRKFCFLYVGLLEKHKGVDYMIDSFLKIKFSGAFEKVELIIIGEGSLQGLVEKAAGNPDNNILFLGKRKNNEVKEIMKKSHVLIVPSVCYENSPTVIYEAASSALAVIASRIGGIPDLIEDGYSGILFSPGNIRDLCLKMDWSVKNPRKLEELSACGVELSGKRSLDNYIKSLFDLIN